MSPIDLQDLLHFWDPWDDLYGSDYQLAHSLFAFGNGGFFGVGLGQSIQKQLYLPEAHTDFILAIIAEELGFLGVLILCFFILKLNFIIFNISKKALENEDPFFFINMSRCCNLDFFAVNYKYLCVYRFIPN